jgi:hypothetical protein
VLPELQYTRHCSTGISAKNTSQRYVDAEVTPHTSNGALLGLVERKSNRLRLAPFESVQVKIDVQDQTVWAAITETVPSPKLHPVLAIGAQTQCVDVNELLTATREIAPLVNDPRLSFTAPPKDAVLLIINASSSRAIWSACYSAGNTVSNGRGEMVPLCSEELDRTLAPYQSWRLPAAFEGKPLIRFTAQGSAIALQMLTPSAPQVQLYKVESTIRFDEFSH